MKSAIIVNAPPGSGKDEFVIQALKLNELNSHTDAPKINHKEFKRKLWELVLTVFSIDRDDFFHLYNNRETKDEPTELLRGRSPRQAMIDVSEKCIKPVFGNGYFGESAVLSLEDGINIFSDGGFREEMERIYDAVEGRMTIVQIQRTGCTYEGDSRGYINELHHRDVEVLELMNNGTIDRLEFNMKKIVWLHRYRFWN